MNVLSFPFRIDPVTGFAVTVAQGGDDAAAEAIAMLALTRLGERSLCPGFGIPDPAYSTGVDVAAEVQAGLRMWGPDGVRVTASRITVDPGTGIADVQLQFSTGGTS